MSAASEIAAAVRDMADARTPTWAAERSIPAETAAAQAAALREAARMIEARWAQETAPSVLVDDGSQAAAPSAIKAARRPADQP